MALVLNPQSISLGRLLGQRHQLHLQPPTATAKATIIIELSLQLIKPCYDYWPVQ